MLFRAFSRLSLLLVLLAFALLLVLPQLALHSVAGANLAGLLYLVNASPRRARGRKRKHHGKRRRGKHRAKKHHGGGLMGFGHNAHKKRRRHAVHFRRNPSSALTRDLAPIGLGALGALTTDVVVGVIPWPAAVEGSAAAPWVKNGTKVALAVVGGWGFGKAFGRAAGAKFMIGALTVLAYAISRDLLQSFAPQLPLGNISESEYPQIGYVGDGMGEVFNPGMGEVLNVPATNRDLSGYDDGMGEVFDQ